MTNNLEKQAIAKISGNTQTMDNIDYVTQNTERIINVVHNYKINLIIHNYITKHI